MDCIFNETSIYWGQEKHICQFREDIDGERSPAFPNNRAIIAIDAGNERYEVRTIHGEKYVMGKGGISEALGRIYYAEQRAEVSVIGPNGKMLSLAEHVAIVAPVVFRIHYTERESDGRIYVAMDAARNGRRGADWTFEGAGDKVAAVIDEYMTKQRKKGVSSYEIEWGRRPLQGFVVDGEYVRHSFPELRKKATELKEMGLRDGQADN